MNDKKCIMVDVELLKKIKSKSAEQGKTIRAWTTEALVTKLNQE